MVSPPTGELQPPVWEILYFTESVLKETGFGGGGGDIIMHNMHEVRAPVLNLDRFYMQHHHANMD